MDEQLRAYAGTGVLHYGGESLVQCEFKVAQEHDGSVRLDCTASGVCPPQWLREILTDDAPTPIELRGTTADGQSVLISGPWFYTPMRTGQPSGPRTSYVLVKQAKVEIGSRDPSDRKEWCFGLTNLLFRSPSRHNSESEGWKPETMHLNIAGHHVRVVQADDYQEARAYLKGRRRVRVTCEARFSAVLSLEQAEKLIGDLCCLLSFAHGTLISWPYVALHTREGAREYTKHWPAKTTAYEGSLPLVPPYSRDDVARFIDGVFNRFRQCEAEWSLYRISRAYIDSKAGDFLETRCLMTVALVEYIVGRDAVLHSEEHYVSEAVFDKALSKLKNAISSLLPLAFPDHVSETRSMADAVRGFNYPSLYRRLNRTARRFGVPIDKPVIKAFIETRNALAHKAQFSTDEPPTEYFRAQWILDRLIRGLLDYRGPYCDVMLRERVDPKQDSHDSQTTASTVY